MKLVLALLALLLVVETTSTFRLNLDGCKLFRSTRRNLFGCSLDGGSGDYSWRYSDLPTGWYADNDRLYTRSGRFLENTVFGTRVRVVDRRTRQQLKRSLFFTFRNNVLDRIAEHQYDFDVRYLIPGRKYESPYTQRVQRIFTGIDGIGGGVGLSRLLPYYTGNGFYDLEKVKQDDDYNIQFYGREYYDNYLERIFGRDFRTQVSVNAGGLKLVTSLREQPYTVRRINVLSQPWTNLYGRYDDRIYPVAAIQRDLYDYDYDYDCYEDYQTRSFRGLVTKISRNIVYVSNDRKQNYQVLFGGCTVIEAFNRALPQIGDYIYWRGYQRSGRQFEYVAQRIFYR